MKLRFWLFLLLSALSSAQVSTIRSVSSLPATCNPGGGAGGAPQDVVSLFNAGTSVVYNCTATNTWTAGGGNPPFNQITSGTNSGAAMVVGTGASLGTSGSGTIAATSAPYNGISSGTNTAAAMVNNTGASTKPQNIGQVAGSQTWLQPGLIPTTVAFSSNTGGSLSTTQVQIQYTLVSAAGETLPSQVALSTNPGSICASSNCQATVTAPSIPTGYTGYTVYSCASGSACSPLKQAASANCVNITINCVISTIGAGAGVPTTNTAYIQPLNIQAASLVPGGGIPSLFFPKTDGNYYPLAGMDFSSGTPLPSPDGTFEFWHRTFVNDSGQNLAGATQQGGGCIKNALFSVCHLSGQTTGTGSTTDDRAIAFRNTDSPSSPTYEQFLGVYGESFTYNNSFACTPVGNPMVQEDCFAAIRARATDNRSAGSNNINIIGIHGTASTAVTTPKLGSCTPCVAGVVGSALQEGVTNQNPGSVVYAGVVGSTLASSGNTNGTGYSFYAKAPATRFASGNAGLFIDSAFSSANSADSAINSVATAKAFFRGAMDVDSLNPTNAGTVAMGGSIGPKGISTTQLTSTTIVSVTQQGTPGSTNYQYAAVYKDAAGGRAAITSNSSTSTGNATLNGSNFNRITLFGAGQPQLTNCPTTIDVYRTVSAGTPSSTGKIGTFTVTDCNGSTSQTFDDTGLAADSTTGPSVNTSGTIVATAYVRGTLNTVQVANDFTSAANTNLQTITGLVWNLPFSAAAKYSFHCGLMYSQATGAVSMQFGIQSASIAPNDLSAFGRVDTSTSAQTTGVLSNLASTTATAIVTFTPSNFGTVFSANLDGTIDLPASGSVNTINIMVQTSNSGDLPTIKRGSYCELY